MAQKKITANTVKYTSRVTNLVDFDEEKTPVSNGTKAIIFFIKAVNGEFPKVAKLQDNDNYYLPESETVRIATELGLFE